MRIFLSYHTKDLALAEGLRAGLLKLDPKADIFFSPVSLGQGFAAEARREHPFRRCVSAAAWSQWRGSLAGS